MRDPRRGDSTRQRKIRPACLDELATLVEAMPERLRLAVHLAAGVRSGTGSSRAAPHLTSTVKGGVIHVRRAVALGNRYAGVGLPKSAVGLRDVAIPPHLLPTVKPHLERHAAWGREGLLFTDPAGKPCPPRRSTRRGGPPVQAAGRPDLRFHDLGTWAPVAAQTGATLAELMSPARALHPQMAMSYQHVAPDRDQQIAARLSKRFEAGR